MSSTPVVPGRFADAGLYALVVAIWGTSWIGLKLQVGADVAVLASVAYRFGVAGVLLVLWSLIRGHGLRLTRNQHLRVAVQGVFLFGINYLCFYGAAQHLTSGLLAVAFSTVVVINIILGALFLGVRLEARMVGGAALGLGGIGLVFWPEVSAVSINDSGLRGVVLALGGTLSAAIGMTLSAANQRAGLRVMPTNAFGMLYSAAVVMVVALVMGTPFTFAWTWAYAGGLAYLVVFSSIIAFSAYLTLLGRIGPARASYASVLFPILALAVSTVVEGYTWTPEAISGVVLVLLGNVLVLIRPRAALAAS
ncbi:MAG: DMT family transporter [Rhodospirillaceae bacterium]